MSKDFLVKKVREEAQCTVAVAEAAVEAVIDGIMKEAAIDPKKAIRERSVICCECGKSFKVLTKRHLATHELTPDQYREKYGYKKGTSLVAKALARSRRKNMQDMKLWEKRKRPPRLSNW